MLEGGDGRDPVGLAVEAESFGNEHPISLEITVKVGGDNDSGEVDESSGYEQGLMRV